MVADTMSLHTFVDASESAYGAVVYARCQYEDGSVSTNIVAAKTRVSPNITASIPRLELMGAVVGVRLNTRIAEVLGIQMTKSTFWCDSVNVLWWVRGRSRNFKPFVAHRVGEIQTQTDPNQWRYVPTKVNPADMLSRGMPANDLAKCNSWWRGPAFLSQTEDMWPRNKIFDQAVGNNEIRRSSRVESRTQEPKVGDKTYHVGTFVAVDEGVESPLAPHKYSSWLKLKRIQAWINRFVGNCQRKGTGRISRESTVDELL